MYVAAIRRNLCEECRCSGGDGMKVPALKNLTHKAATGRNVCLYMVRGMRSLQPAGCLPHTLLGRRLRVVDDKKELAKTLYRRQKQIAVWSMPLGGAA